MIKNDNYEVIGMNADLARNVQSATQQYFEIGATYTKEHILKWAGRHEYHVIILQHTKQLYLIPLKVVPEDMPVEKIKAYHFDHAHLIAKPVG